MTRKAEPARRVARRASRAAPARHVRSRSASRSAKEDTPYHHGALRDALLQAAERVLEREGLAGLTLRAVAREAGVSHAAPTHHFGDLTGLVSELAAIGFRQFNAAMAAACTPDTPHPGKGLARAKAYIAYAQAHPGMYGLMFRTERLDYSRPSLHEAAEASFAGLASAIAASRQEQIEEEALTLESGGGDRPRLVAGAWLHHAAARRPAQGHPATAARGHRRGTTPRHHAQACDGQAAGVLRVSLEVRPVR